MTTTRQACTRVGSSSSGLIWIWWRIITRELHKLAEATGSHSVSGPAPAPVPIHYERELVILGDGRPGSAVWMIYSTCLAAGGA